MNPILMERAVGVGSTSRATIRAANLSEGKTTVFILEPDGSLHQYPQEEQETEHHYATVEVQGMPQPSLIERIIAMTFDRLKLRTVELHVCEEAE
jgi:hypothetical protein